METENLIPKHEVRDLIYYTLFLTERTKVPALFLGNPGIAKTTGVKLFAQLNGYIVTTLIGTQRVAEEILGYMVNDTGEKRLITYTPDWFDAIWEIRMGHKIDFRDEAWREKAIAELEKNPKTGSKVLLFVDEISQAADNVQGAMLQLIFERKVGGRDNSLPEDCLIVSAANYKGNIPPQCGIQAPTLNRFSIINVKPTSGRALLEEFTQNEADRENDLPVLRATEITPQIRASIKKNLDLCMGQLFDKYSKNDGDDFCLNFDNTEFNEIFDQPGDIYGFITGRTLYYLKQQIEGLIGLGIVRKVHREFIRQVVLGLIGFATNSFTNDNQKEDWYNAAEKAVRTIIRSSVEENMDEINKIEIDYKKGDLNKNISDYMRYTDGGGNPCDVNLINLVKKIEDQYPVHPSAMKIMLEGKSTTEFLSDFQKIIALQAQLKANNNPVIKQFITKLGVIIASFESYQKKLLKSI